MSKKTLLSGMILGLTVALTYFLVKNREWYMAMAMYWAGFMVLFGYIVAKAYIDKKESIQIAVDNKVEAENGGLWLAPLSRKVVWGENGVDATPQEEMGVWQDKVIHKIWNVHGSVWHWVGNTVKDEWPSTEALKDDMRWWHGVAIYQLEESKE